VKAGQILPTELERCATKTVILEKKATNVSKAANAPALSEDPNTGLRTERTATSQLLRIALAYTVVIAWVILD